MTDTAAAFGVHSEVGQLRKVMVCAPGRAHQRLTPSNCDDLLFDDVLWVDNAKRDHFDFMTKMRDRGVEVVEMHNLLAETVAVPEAKKWILDNQVTPIRLASALSTRSAATSRACRPRDLAETLIGGLSTQEFPEHIGGEMLALVRDAAGVNEYLLPPLPNTLYTRDTTCWIYGGVTLNPLYWPARHEETILTTSIYKFHPRLRRQGQCLVGRPDQGLGSRDARRRRRHADRQGQRADRHERAHLAPGDQPARAGPVRARRRGARHHRRNAEAARGDAYRHGLHLRRPRLRADLSRHRQQDRMLLVPAGLEEGNPRSSQGRGRADSRPCARRSA